jgi:transcription initiation factor TFIIE subunit alpha
MQEKLLKSLVEDLAGSEAEPIVDLLFNKKDVNEFLIAKKMKLTINQIRNILYKLSAEGLVSFIRKKDNRKGWYIYFWTLNTEKCLIRLELELTRKIKDLENQLKNREQKRFYTCNSCGVEVTEETALENDFSCSECAEVYVLSNNENPIKEINNRIKLKERELKLIQNEINEIKQKQAKKKISDEKKNKTKKQKKSAKKQKKPKKKNKK